LKLHSSKVDTLIILAGLLFEESVRYINFTAEMVMSHIFLISQIHEVLEMNMIRV